MKKCKVKGDYSIISKANSCDPFPEIYIISGWRGQTPWPSMFRGTIDEMNAKGLLNTGGSWHCMGELDFLGEFGL